MKFKVKAKDLNQALKVVSIVAPRPVNAQSGAGFLFVIKTGEMAHVYSNDIKHVVRCEMPIFDVDGEGPFVYPAASVEAFQYLGDQDVSFTVGDQDGNFTVGYETDSGASAEHTTFDPKDMMTHLDRELETATDDCVVQSGVLREALQMGREMLPKDDGTAKPHLKTVQVFDAAKEDWKAGDGYMFAADGIRAYYFESEAFRGKKMAVAGEHLAVLTPFLAKCQGQVTIKGGGGYSYAVDDVTKNVLGWANQTTQHGKFKYYSTKNDNFVLDVGRAALLNALKYARSELDKKKDKVQVNYSHLDGVIGSLQLTTSGSSGKSKSFSVPAKVVAEEKSLAETQDFSIGFNLEYLLGFAQACKANDIRLRFMKLPSKEQDGKERAVVRFIDEFRLTGDGRVTTSKDGSYECLVTRFCPSKE